MMINGKTRDGGKDMRELDAQSPPNSPLFSYIDGNSQRARYG
jgi:hypothetical protein